MFLRGKLRHCSGRILFCILLAVAPAYLSPRSAPAAENESKDVEPPPEPANSGDTGDDDEESQKPRKRRILYFYASWCPYCRAVEEKAWPPLKKVKWRIGPKASNHIQEMNAEKSPSLIDKYKLELLPSFILIADGKEIARKNGYLTAGRIAEMYNDGLKEDENEE